MKSRNIEETKKIAEILLRKISTQSKNNKTATTITLSGDLGSGKTTFTQQIGKILEIKEKINSPTFVISKKYSIKSKKYSWKKLIHIDAYRLEREEDLELIGLKKDLENPENLIFIEWPEMIEKWLNKKNKVKIDLKYINEKTREIKFSQTFFPE